MEAIIKSVFDLFFGIITITGIIFITIILLVGMIFFIKDMYEEFFL